MTETFDLIVVGGGRASGLAIAAAQSGLKTALVERDKLGGACPNRGCVPSKLLIGFAEAANRVREADRHFIDAQLRQIDTARVFESVNDYVGGVDGRYEGRVKAAGAELIRGEAAFIGHKQLAVGDRTLTAERIVIATGSRPSDAPYSELPVWTSDSLFPLEGTPPKSLLVIGGGFIGCEMSAFFAGVGVETHLFARRGQLLGREDRDIEKVFQAEFGKNVHTHCHASLTSLTSPQLLMFTVSRKFSKLSVCFSRSAAAQTQRIFNLKKRDSLPMSGGSFRSMHICKLPLKESMQLEM